MITGYLELLEERYRDQLDDRAQEFIGFAVDGAERMRNLIEQLLAYSRLGRREQGAVPVDLNAIVDDVLADLAHTLAETGAEVTRDYLPLLLGIPGQLTQLYQNLLANALKFRGTNPVRIRLGATRLNGDWLLSVTDNGIGIAAEYHQDIFVIFRRLHTREEYAGTGLGLALCKRIVDQHSGRIWVESEPNRGTTFWFTLPAPTDAH
jgi:light-regulated signal transduction histidine kinase (bacteriophytochrome)